ncbi:MAG: MBOAT family O-acyltransferase [Bacteroidota bacterium]
MLFNSLSFLIFFPVVTILFFLVQHRYRWALLLAASCFFYMSFRPVYILILAVMITVDYFSAIAIENSGSHRRKKIFLIGSIVVNVGMLAFFKYYDFLNNFISALLPLGKGAPLLPVFSFLLPIGLSFHTFQSMSYTLEVYGGNQKAERHFGIFSLYVMFYPQLVAGPIERPGHLLPQFRIEHKFDYVKVSRGLRRMLWGLFKKMVIADRLAVYVDPVFDQPHLYGGFPVVWAGLFYTFQIYCDFSGYCDIAIGAAGVMGFELTENFRSPFFSKSVSEFWKRWHISLTSWLFDYVYKPVSFLKRGWGKWGAVYAVMITFSLCGLWHGARWTFVAWGLLNGAALAVEIIFRRNKRKVETKQPSKFRDIPFILLTFAFVSLVFIVARASTIPEALFMLKSIPELSTEKIIGLPIITRFAFELNFIFIFLLMSAEWFFLNEETKIKNAFVTSTSFRYAVNILLLLLILFFGVFEQQAFIYFQF